ncbi:MAG: biotin--[acetyl-CoA-carboxylase] ligase [Candidatus Stygibacter frigidus]|nr:biotin--[acetyl-CoA-carboxylase] ligase [Candidatus Stygibacter frigidus]
MDNITHSFLDKYVHYDYISSTMEKAEELIENSEFKGNFLIIADKQGIGIGRNGNHWYSPSGGLWFTLGIYGFTFKSNFTLFCGLQLLKTLEQLISDPVMKLVIKWPNDLYLNNKKLAGIIVKHIPRSNYYLAGIGLDSNMESFPEELESIATSLKLETGMNYSSSAIIHLFLDNLNAELPEYLSTYRFDESYYTSHDYLNDHELSINTEFAEYTGRYHGISPEGAILLRLPNGAIQPFYAGEIRIIP